MASNLFALPWRPVLENLNVAPGAQVWFTQTGTNTAKPIYSNSTLVTQRSNPVIADAVGRVPITFLDAAITYRVRIYARGATVGVDTPLEEYEPYVPGVFADAGALSPVADAAAASATAASTSAAAAAASAVDLSAAVTAAEAAEAGAETAEAGAEAAEAGVLAALAGTSLGTVILNAANRTILAALSYALGLPAYLTEAGREGTFVFDSSNLVAEVAADTNQGIFVAPASDTTGASGAWKRQFSGLANVLWWGAVPGVGDTSAAFVAADATLKAIAGNAVGGTYKGSIGLYIPGGLAFFQGTTTWDRTHTYHTQGDGTGLDGGTATVVNWSTNTTAIRLQRYNTSGASTVDGVTHFGADGSSFDGLNIVGVYSGTEGEYHGIHAKCRFKISNCYISNFAGDGIHSVAGAGGGANEGNTNLSVIDTVAVSGCRDGLQISGGDSNVWSIRSLNTPGNRRWGRNDSAFLANAYYDGHSDANGVTPGSPCTMVSYGGNRYTVIDGQDIGASTNAPSGTTADNTWWYYLSAGGVDAGLNILAWTNGLSVRAGGAARYNNVNAPITVIGSYTEGGQAPVQAQAPCVIIGGLQGAGVRGTAAYFDGGSSDIGMNIRGDVQLSGRLGLNSTTLNINAIAQAIINFKLNTVSQGYIKIADARMYYNVITGLFHDWRINEAQIASLTAAEFNLVGGVYKVAGTQVVGARGAAVADAAALTSVNATNAAGVPTQAEFNAFVAEFNKLRTDVGAVRTAVNTDLARERAHGLIAP